MDVTSIAANSASTAAAPSQNSGAAQLANEDTFLKLLVAQMKNQDPMKPQDGTEFLAQLAQFSQLEQLIGIRQQLNILSQPVPETTTPETPEPTASASAAAAVISGERR